MFKLIEIKTPYDKIIIDTYINSGEGYKLVNSREEILYNVQYIPSGDFAPKTNEEYLKEWGAG